MNPHRLKSVLLKPAAAIRDPPAHPGQRDGRAQRPPERQGQIGNDAQYAERGPKDFSLHIVIVNCMKMPKKVARQKSNILSYGDG